MGKLVPPITYKKMDHTIDLRKEPINSLPPQDSGTGQSTEDTELNKVVTIFDIKKLQKELLELLNSKNNVKKDPKKKHIEIIIDLELIEGEDLIFIENTKLNLITQINNSINNMNYKKLQPNSKASYDVIKTNTEIICK